MQRREIRDHISYWLQPLRLSAWQVTFEICSYRQIHCLAQIQAKRRKHTAHIKIARDGAKHTCDPYDLEEVVVHELLHLWYPRPNQLGHQGLDATAWALIEYRRRCTS